MTWFDPLPAWAQDRIRQAGEEELDRYQEQYIEVLQSKMGKDCKVSGLDASDLAEILR